jgi:hypothetical protein
LTGCDPVGRPGLPRRQDMGSQPRRDGGLLTRCPHRSHGLGSLGLPSAAPGARPLGGPRDHGEEALVSPRLPPGREEEGPQVLVDPLPPEVHQRGQRWDL